MPDNNIFHVSWDIINHCNYNCSYCVRTSKDQNCVISRDRLMQMAWRALSKPHPLIHIHIGGGEPTLHPFLPDIINYILSSGREALVTLETNGTWQINDYMGLAREALRHKLRFSISIHPGHSSSAHILELIRQLAIAGFPVRANLVLDSSQFQKLKQIALDLAKLRVIAPFKVACIPAGSSAATSNKLAWAGEYEKNFAKISPQHKPQLTQWPDDAPYPDLCGLAGQGFCVAGYDYMRIEPNGKFGGTSCGADRIDRPLWAVSDDEYASFPSIIPCSRPCCARPVFASMEEAEEWKAGQNILLARWFDETPMLLNPLQPEPNSAQMVRSRLKTLPLSNSRQDDEYEFIDAVPNLVLSRLGDIARIYDILEDAKSRQIFLRCVKALKSGNTGYLPPMEEAKEGPAKGQTMPIPQGAYVSEINMEARDSSALQPCLGSIRQHLPDLHISLILTAGSLLDVVLTILEHVPGYRFKLSWDKPGRPCLHGVNPQKPCVPVLRCAPRANIGAEIRDRLAHLKPLHSFIDKIDPETAVALSYIVLADNDHSKLRTTLDSILLQTGPPSEIIVIGSARFKEQSQVISQYNKIWPHRARWLEPIGQEDAASRINLALGCARGEHVVILETGAVLDTSYAATGSEMLISEDADAVIFGRCQNASSPVSGINALALLAENTEDAPYGLLVSRRLLAELNLYPQTEQPLECFAVRLLFYARRVSVSQFKGYFAPGKKLDGKKELWRFADFAKWLAQFFEDNRLDDDGLQINILRGHFAPSRKVILEAIRQADKAGRLDNLLSPDLLQSLSSSRAAMECLILEYALVNGRLRNFNFSIAPEEFDWRSVAALPYEKGNPFAYGNADGQSLTAPLLSVVMPNYNHGQYLPKSLGSILSQSMRDFELIIVDDASTDNSWEILTAWADCEPRIRLYQMDRNSRQGACRNIGVEKARGRYLLFIDSDDMAEPGYFEYGLKLIENHGSDLALFSYQSRAVSGEIMEQQILEDAQFDNQKSRTLYLTGKFNGAPFAKIFRLDAIRKNSCLFAENVYHQDHYFVGKMAANASKVTQSSFVAYSAIKTPNSSVRPSIFKYLYIHSAARFYEYFQQMLNDRYDIFPTAANSRLWSLEYLHLAAWLAFYQATGEVALADADYRRLAKSPIFIFALLMGYARLAKGQELPPDLLDNAPEKNNEVQRKALVSVIIHGQAAEKDVRASIDSILAVAGIEMEIILAGQHWTWLESDYWHQFLAVNPNVKVFNEETTIEVNEKLIDAAGMATGEYIMFIQAGLELEISYLPHALALFQRYPEADAVWPVAEGKSPSPDWPALPVNGLKFARQAQPENLLELSGIVLRRRFAHKKLCRADSDAAIALQIATNAANVLAVGCQALKASRPMQLNLKNILAICNETDGLDEGSRKRLVEWLFKNTALKTWEEAALLNDSSVARSKRLNEFACFMLRDIAQNVPPLPVKDEGYSLEKDIPEMVFARPACNREKLLSILVYVHNQAQMIHNILPLLTVERDDLEIMLIDDASMDKSPQLASELASSDNRVIVCRSVFRAGKGRAFNMACPHASGKYVLFVDDLSLIEKLALAGILPVLEKGEANVYALSGGGQLETGTQAAIDLLGSGKSLYGFDSVIYEHALLKNASLRFDDCGAASDVFLIKALALAKLYSQLDTGFAPQRGQASISGIACRVAARLEMAADLTNSSLENSWLKYLASEAGGMLQDLAYLAAAHDNGQAAENFAMLIAKACAIPEIFRMILSAVVKRDKNHE